MTPPRPTRSACCCSAGSPSDALVGVFFRTYKKWVAPALHALSLFPGGCAFQPTCSEYAALALAEHGLLRGGAMTLWRLLRCNPACRGGWDPVPSLKSPGAGM